MNPNNTFTLVKDYGEALKSGYALYYWLEGREEDTLPNVIKQWQGWTRNNITKSQVKNIKKEAGFHDTIEEIITDIRSCGSHGETIQDKWVVFGNYADNSYSLGY